MELECDGEVGGDRCTTLLDNPAQNDWVVVSRAEDSGNGVGVCPGNGCLVMQVAGVKGCGGINNAADGKTLGAAQNLSELECYCWSVVPADRTPMINAGMVFSDRHYGGINYPRGGVGQSALKLVEGLEKAGGEIQYQARVAEIILDAGRAIGVKLRHNCVIYINFKVA